MRIVLIIALLPLLFCGCVKNNQAPVWLEISEFTLIQNPDISAEDYGYLSHGFKDAWIYVDNKLVGVYELPCKVPVLMEGTKEIAIYPAVRNNGISATKKIYPFVKSYVLIEDLLPGQKYQIHPTTYYYTSCQYELEEFVDPSSSLDVQAGSATIGWENDPAISLSGYYGHVHLTSATPEFIAVTPAVQLPGSNAEVYLEMEYITDVPILQSILALTSDGVTTNPNIQMNGFTGHEWKKIYIDMKEVISNSTSANSFRQGFYAVLPGGVSASDIYLDNIRIVH